MWISRWISGGRILRMLLKASESIPSCPSSVSIYLVARRSPAGPSAYIPAAQESLDLFTALDEAGNDYDRVIKELNGSEGIYYIVQ